MAVRKSKTKQTKESLKLVLSKTAKLRKKRSKVVFIGSDEMHSRISEIDSPSSMSYAEKLTLITQLSLFEFQLRNATNDLPRFLRTTACIRKV